MFGNTWWSAKVGADILADIPLDFHESIRIFSLKNLIYFSACTNTK